MYGLIHRAARQMAIASLGEAAWSRVLENCGASEGDFLSGKLYSDDLTGRLISALVEESDRPAADLLRDFGRYWVSFIESSPYAAMLDMTGDDLFTCLQNLDRMHATIKVSLPEARLPAFSVSQSGPDQLTVLYRSGRAGLEPMVEGLLEGLLSRFGYCGQVAWSPAPDGVRFEVRLEQRLAA